MIVHPALKFTRADYEKLPEDFRAELIDGVLIKEPSPSFEHQELSKRIFLALHRAVGGWRGQFAPLDVHIDEHNVLQPDLLVLREDSRPLSGERVESVPLLVVEVLTKTTAQRDRQAKTAVYLGAGVDEVWLVDGSARTLEIHTTGAVRVHRGKQSARSQSVAGFELAPDEIFGT